MENTGDTHILEIRSVSNTSAKSEQTAAGDLYIKSLFYALNAINTKLLIKINTTSNMNITLQILVP
jgi:hypothetical protein